MSQLFPEDHITFYPESIFSSKEDQMRFFEDFLLVGSRLGSLDDSVINLRMFYSLNKEFPISKDFSDLLEVNLDGKSEYKDMLEKFLKRYKVDYFKMALDSVVTAYFSKNIIIRVEEGFVFQVYYLKDQSDLVKKLEKTIDRLSHGESGKSNLFQIIYRKGSWHKSPIKNRELEDDIIASNYNDDIPDEAVQEFLRDKEQTGIMIFNGDPGTGKSYYLRYLAKTNPNLKFLFLRQEFMSQISSEKFLKFLFDNKGSVIVFEDCEDLVKRREQNTNIASLSSLLNLSDGIIGDQINLKFICTFNCKVSEIDEAIMRKGRMQVHYEFKPLAIEKANNLLKKLDSPAVATRQMTLADIYFSHKENNFSRKPRKAIGFGNN